ncbi:MAG: nickel insertion protein [Lachnospiraceae bacterium]|nr:nickel insertion protein [Lachnospiraceae bacterium]
MNYKERDVINVLETNLDDCTGEILGYVMDKLFAVGAKDVFYTPIYMKKNRPAYKITVLCDDEKIERIEDIIFTETTSIGIRKHKEERTILLRCFKEIETKYGKLKVKAVQTPLGERIYPEYESARELAEKNRVPLSAIYKQV